MIGAINKASSLFAQNAIRLNSLLVSKASAQLSSGNRLVSASIDPSAIAISAQFRSQIGGTEQAIYNSQDAINLTRTADATLGSQEETLLRMRDIAVRANNDATLTADDKARLNAEFQSLNTQLTQTGEAANFNTKQLTSAVNPYGTQTVQTTADNNPAAQSSVTINSSTAATLGTAGQDLTVAGGPGNAITAIDNALSTIANQRASLGVTENSLNYTTNDLEAQRINMAAANSRIADTDIAATMTEFTKGLMLNKFGLAMLAKTNAQGAGVLKLMGI